MAKPSYKLPDRTWMVIAPLTKVVVEAPDREGAIAKVLNAQAHTRGKPWLAVNWDVHIATEAELRDYAAFAEAHRPAQPTAKSVKRKTVHERLGLFDGPT